LGTDNRIFALDLAAGRHLKSLCHLADEQPMYAGGLERPDLPSEAAHERCLAKLLNELPDAVIVIDRLGTLQWANHTAETLMGRSLGDSIGVSGLDLVHPDDLEFVLRSLASIQGKEVGAPIEVRLRTTNGWRLMELVGVPVGWLQDGAILLSIRDLTQRRRFELVHDHDARLRSLVQNSAAITMLVSPDGCIQSVSGAVTRLLGHDPELIEGQPLTDLVPECDHPALQGAFERASRGASVAGPVTITVPLIRHGKTGTLPIELSLVNLIDDPTVGGYVITGHDVTDRQRADFEVRKALSLLTATLDATADGLLVVDNHGQVVSVNRRLTEMWRVPESLLRTRDGRSLTAYVRDQLSSPEEFSAKVEKYYTDLEGETNDTLVFKDGRVFERVSKPQAVDGTIVGRVWSFRDITDRKRLEEQLSFQAFHDSLTGLGNRALFQDRLQHAVARIERTHGRLAVLFLDLDNLKTVNDSLGHSAGDLLLQTTAEVIVGCLRNADTAARLGGDEFGILLEQVERPEEAVKLAERIMEAIRRRLTDGSSGLQATLSIGITHARPGFSSDQLLRNADLAMYVAKERGGNRYAEFDNEMQTVVVAAP
jgi:diguanylate cyclase (GGDEF)-like protein/PAS domain S-box-containing protein